MCDTAQWSQNLPWGQLVRPVLVDHVLPLNPAEKASQEAISNSSTKKTKRGPVRAVALLVFLLPRVAPSVQLSQVVREVPDDPGYQVGLLPLWLPVSLELQDFQLAQGFLENHALQKVPALQRDRQGQSLPEKNRTSLTYHPLWHFSLDNSLVFPVVLVGPGFPVGLAVPSVQKDPLALVCPAHLCHPKVQQHREREREKGCGRYHH